MEVQYQYGIQIFLNQIGKIPHLSSLCGKAAKSFSCNNEETQIIFQAEQKELELTLM